MRSRGAAIVGFLLAGLGVALVLAFVVSPYASSSPDGLEKVSIDKGFDDTARDHDLADSPLADYSVKDVGNEKLSTGLSGIIGVLVTLAAGLGIFALVQHLRRSAPTAPS